MDKHELALRTYEAIQKRKRQKELKRRMDLEAVGWNRSTQSRIKWQKRYYDRKRTII
jgi:hypothetical protein